LSKEANGIRYDVSAALGEVIERCLCKIQKGSATMARLEDVVRSLIKAKAGTHAGQADERNIVFGLNEFSDAQRQRGVLLILLLVFLLAAPLVLTQVQLPPGSLPYLIGGSGIFAAGTVKLLLDSFQDVSRAHTLAIVCQGLESTDSKDVLVAWLKKS
jgi:hypothetical protein